MPGSTSPPPCATEPGPPITGSQKYHACGLAGLDRLDDLDDRAALLRRIQITGQHRIATRQHADRPDAVDKILQLDGVDAGAGPVTVLRVIGKLHGVERPDVDAEGVASGTPPRRCPACPKTTCDWMLRTFFHGLLHRCSRLTGRSDEWGTSQEGRMSRPCRGGHRPRHADIASACGKDTRFSASRRRLLRPPLRRTIRSLQRPRGAAGGHRCRGGRVRPVRGNSAR